MAIDDATTASATLPGSDEEPAPPTTSGGGSAWTALRPLLLRLHFYAGLLTAPFLLVAALSGLLYSLSFQAEKVIYTHELEAPPGDRTRPLDEQVEAARDAHPGGTVTAVWPAPGKDRTTRVLMSAPDMGESRSLAVFVDPYTAEVRGELTSYGSSGALPLRTWLDELHRDLHLGDLGRNYSELAASWLWVVALGGLLLWARRRRARKRALVLPERGLSGRRKTLSWHGAAGVWTVLGLLALSATGLTWSRYAGENIGRIQDSLGGSTPVVAAALDPSRAGGDGHAEHGGDGDGRHEGHEGAGIGLDKALEVARERGVGVESGEIAVTLPADGNGYVVKETDKLWPVHLDTIAIDPADGDVLDELRFADHPVLAKLTRFGIDLHMGLALGLANQLALAALAACLVALVVWGYRMWWLRRPTGTERFGAGRPVPRGAWRRVPLPVLLPLAAVTALTGWFLPLLGISLLGFLVLDVLLGALAARRRRTAA
ncbi:PepSY domain-containing protein [Streptomyces sp. GC420]|uniref:PepSY-associated TM helix domain-containing protein n=1 Tax=Streptomyces sp. GC420 TaxID=2697568 RepID=UPI001414EDDE|nr:PepSY domain-containing protein [Streptomyces sp. GC420]NBM17559.1 PepSY domain-containing protein [Streptomyces sp. GC420]